MKKLAIALALLLIFGSAQDAFAADIYAKIGIITEVDYEHDTITITDIDGHMWQWEGAEDWDTFDLVCFILYDHDTELTREDDEIISITYNGYIEPEKTQWFWEISKG